jgi:hypothetical protein
LTTTLGRRWLCTAAWLRLQNVVRTTAMFLPSPRRTRKKRPASLLPTAISVRQSTLSSSAIPQALWLPIGYSMTWTLQYPRSQRKKQRPDFDPSIAATARPKNLFSLGSGSQSAMHVDGGRGLAMGDILDVGFRAVHRALYVC